MFISREDAQTGDLLTGKLILWHHSPNSGLEHTFWVMSAKLCVGGSTKSTWVTGVMINNLCIFLTSSNNFVSIDNDNKIAKVSIWCIGWLLLATENIRNLTCKTT